MQLHTNVTSIKKENFPAVFTQTTVKMQTPRWNILSSLNCKLWTTFTAQNNSITLKPQGKSQQTGCHKSRWRYCCTISEKHCFCVLQTLQNLKGQRVISFVQALCPLHLQSTPCLERRAGTSWITNTKPHSGSHPDTDAAPSSCSAFTAIISPCKRWQKSK